MVDLNVMLQEHARSGLQTRLDKAVTDGDTEEARKITADMVKLETATQPKAPPFGQAEIIAEMGKNAKYGVDPKWSAKAMELGKNMDPRKFTSAGAFAEALTKAVDEEFKPAGKGAAEGDGTDGGEGEGDGTDGEEGEGDDTPAKPAKKRASDAPGDGDAGGNRSRRAVGPWTKISDAPADVQKEIKRTADKFAPKTKEGREKYVAAALGSHYTRAQLAKGKR